MTDWSAERLARAVLSQVCEPGDPRLTRLVAGYGAVAAVEALRRGGDAPLLVVAMPYVIWGGGGLLLCLIVWGLVVHRQRKREREIRAKRIALNRRFHSR